jgi:predicted enzyme related to lactoylglutathione lyase
MTQPVAYVEIQATIKLARDHGGQLVVEPFTLPGLGMGCTRTTRTCDVRWNRDHL